MAKRAMITGGAGAIAGALSDRLVERGYDLILVDIDLAALARAQAALPGSTQIVAADLTQAADLERISDLIATAPNLSLFVNNAGIIRPGDVIDLSPADIALQMDLNLRAPIRLTQAAAQRFAGQGAGSILSIVSAAGLVSLPGSAAYSASKFGLRGFLIGLAQEVKARGVQVCGVFPGAVDTPMLRYEATHGGSVLNFLNKDVLKPADVAAACLKAMDEDRLEVLLPASDGLLSRLLCAFPALMPRFLPLFVKQGEQGLQRFIQSRGLTPQTPSAKA